MLEIKKKVLLGSGSPRRQQLLKELGINFRVLTSNTDEIPLPHLSRGNIAEYLAEEKAEALVNNLHEGELLITADTIVWLDESMLGKPADADEAFSMLSRLNGRTHQVYTAICFDDKARRKIICVRSDVAFKKVSEEDIRKYIQNYHPFDKAGSYGAQECLEEGINPCSKFEMDFLNKIGKEKLFERTLAINFKKHFPLIDHIEGSYFNVMGLPVVELVEEILKYD
jgi:septum formation protein